MMVNDHRHKLMPGFSEFKYGVSLRLYFVLIVERCALPIGIGLAVGCFTAAAFLWHEGPDDIFIRLAIISGEAFIALLMIVIAMCRFGHKRFGIGMDDKIFLQWEFRNDKG
jgi:hypothetical protein